MIGSSIVGTRIGTSDVVRQRDMKVMSSDTAMHFNEAAHPTPLGPSFQRNFKTNYPQRKTTKQQRLNIHPAQLSTSWDA